MISSTRCVVVLVLLAGTGCRAPRPLEALGLVHKGDAAMSSGDHSAATDAYREALRLDDRSYEARIGLGRAFARAAVLRAGHGKLVEAKEMAVKSADAFREAIILKPDELEGYAGLGAAYGFIGEHDKAYAVFSRLEEKRPRDPRVHEALAIVLTDLGRHVDSLPHFDAALGGESEAGDAEVFLKFGDTLVATGRYELAMSAYRRFHDLAPDDPRFILGVADTLLGVGDIDGALGAYRTIGRELPFFRDRALLGEGEALLAMGDADGAATAFTDGLDEIGKRPDRSEAEVVERRGKMRVGIARAHLAADRKDEAVRALGELLKDDPDNEGAMVLLGGVYVRDERYDEAIPVLEKAVRVDPISERGHFLLADALALSKRYERARAAYEAAIRLSPDNSALLNNYAWMLVTNEDEKIRDCSRGAHVAERAVMLSAARSAESLDTLAEAYRCLGRPGEAIEVIDRAIHVSPGDRLLFERREGYEAAVRAKLP